MQAVSFFLVLQFLISTFFVHASDDEKLYNALCAKNLTRQEKVSLLSQMSFKQAVSSRGIINDESLFMSEMSQRPEIASVSWGCGHVMKLAAQIWQLRLAKPDSHYHKDLYQICRHMMKAHGEKKETIDDVMAIVVEWAKAKSKKQQGPPSGMSMEEYEARQNQKRIYNTEATRKRREARKNGFCLPLLKYIQVKDPTKTPPELLFQEALQYMDKYPTAHSFYISLRNLFKTLNIDESRTCRLVRDPQISQYYRQRAREAKLISQLQQMLEEDSLGTAAGRNTPTIDSDFSYINLETEEHRQASATFDNDGAPSSNSYLMNSDSASMYDVEDELHEMNKSDEASMSEQQFVEPYQYHC